MRAGWVCTSARAWAARGSAIGSSGFQIRYAATPTRRSTTAPHSSQTMARARGDGLRSSMRGLHRLDKPKDPSVQVASVKYFIYSENLHSNQLKERAPEAVFLLRGYLPDHTLTFPRWSSQWRCGLASITPSVGDRVWGVVFEITPEDLKIIDQYGDEVPPGAFRHCIINVCPEHEANQAPQKEMVTTHRGRLPGRCLVQECHRIRRRRHPRRAHRQGQTGGSAQAAG